METYNGIKAELAAVNAEIRSQFSRARALPGMETHAFGDWEKTCEGIGAHLAEETLRVAVVGAVKSGKSTFVNSLFQGDYLKRGAGVVTSIVTRVRSGRELKARLIFKSWDEVNAELEQALVLFPSMQWRSQDGRFDLRRERDRRELLAALDTLDGDQLIAGGTRTANSVLMTSYLQGYETVAPIIASEPVSREYRDERFTEQQRFVGSDALAVYLRDVALEIDREGMGYGIEIADCQGSDSPNPLHLAMIQDYLLLTHLIVYVVSSRTGLRQADIRFLSMIRKMGIMDNILFVVNCDFSEHDTLADLKALVARVREELTLIRPEPEIFSLSALLNLFRSLPEKLPEKDALRLTQWERERELVAFAEREQSRFAKTFHHKLTGEKYALLLKNHLERLRVVAAGVDRWIHTTREILAKDAAGAADLLARLKTQQQHLEQVKAMIRSTLDGAVGKLKQELKLEVDRFFDSRSGHVVGDVGAFIRGHAIALDAYDEHLAASGFAGTLYLVYQEFKRALDTYMAESVNPEVLKFIKGIEARIAQRLKTIGGPFDAMIREAQAEYDRAMADLGLAPGFTAGPAPGGSDLERIKEVAGLQLPPAVATMRYSARIKTEAVMRFGLYTVVRAFKQLLKKPLAAKGSEARGALADGVRRMKRETERSVLTHFKDYQENIKFQYVSKLVDAVSGHLFSDLLDRFQAFFTDHTRMVDLIGAERLDKKAALETLTQMTEASAAIAATLERISGRIDATAATGEDNA